jgi:hypothetical protein
MKKRMMTTILSCLKPPIPQWRIKAKGEERASDVPTDDLGQVIVDAQIDCESEKEREKLERMLDEHKKNLYPNCKDGQKKLGSTLELLQWKVVTGLSDKRFEKLQWKAETGLSDELGPHIHLILVSNTIKYINLNMSLIKIYSCKVCEAARGTNLYAYYACENLRTEVTEGIDFLTVSEQYTDNFIYYHQLCLVSFIIFVMMIYIHIDLLLLSSKQSGIDSHRLNA